jgi:hypothetical protein
LYLFIFKNKQMKKNANLPGFISELGKGRKVNFSAQFDNQFADDSIITIQAKRSLPGMGGIRVSHPTVFDGGSGYGFWCELGCGAAFVACSAACGALTGPGAGACIAACTVLWENCTDGC